MRKHDLKTLEAGVLTVGVDESPPPPFHMGEPNSPNFGGFEVDLTRTIAEKLGVRAKYKSELWSEILRDLIDGRLDLICTAATITNGRRRIIDFGAPYFDTGLAITIKRGSPIQTTTDLRDKVIGVRIATSAEEFARKEIAARSFRAFHLNVEAYRALFEEVVDAVIDDFHIAKSFEWSIPSLKVIAKIAGTKCQYGMMFAKGNDELRNAVNEALVEIRTEGTYDRFYEKWFTRLAQRGL
jgi:ABC-type amino acid transport substrate-binding protein